MQIMHGGNDPIFHRDIRWANIIKLPSLSNERSKWMLIDWDEAAGLYNKAALHLSEENHAPEVFKDNHGEEVDVWAVGRLITDAKRWIFDVPNEIYSFGIRLQSSNRPGTKVAFEEALLLLTKYTDTGTVPSNERSGYINFMHM